MPRKTSEAASIGARGSQLPPPPAAFDYNPKFEYEENEDALAEFDAISPDGPGEGSSATSQKMELESGPSSATGTKRKRPLKLTPSQRERKRAIDREAQRSIRIKTKNYIAHLENLVKVMEQSDTNGPDGGNSRTRELMNQLKQSQDEVRSLREAMLGMQRTLSTVLGDFSNLNPELLAQRHSSYSASPPSVSEAHNPTTIAGPSDIPPEPQKSHTQPPVRAQRNMSTTTMPAAQPRPEASRGVSRTFAEPSNFTPLRPRREAELFYHVEYHLNRVYAAGQSAIGDTAFDEDVPVRAVLEGWASVEERYDLDVCWQAVREVDQFVWAKCGIVERMAIIHYMRTKLLYQIKSRAAAPLPPMPAFMTQEVARHARHADIIDHFIWPGFRHCLVEQPQKYITNHFTDKFRFNLKLLWPFDISFAYTKDPITQMYASTPDFINRQWDLRCWTMQNAFFDGSEELMSSIPSFDVPLQRSLSLPGQAPIGMSHITHHPSVGMVEEQEVDDDDLDGNVGVVHDSNMVAGVGGDWHSISPSHSMHQYWNMNGSAMDQAYNGLAGHTGNRYSM